MAVKAPPPAAAAAPYNWSGLHVGGNFGGAWTSGNLNIPGSNFYGGLTEFISGVQAGNNFQAGQFLLGVEGDFDWATPKGYRGYLASALPTAASQRRPAALQSA
jgi:hypothetical protein